MILKELIENYNLNPTHYYLIIDNGCCGDEEFKITGYAPDTQEIELDNDRATIDDWLLNSDVVKSPAYKLAEEMGWEVIND